MIFSFIEPNTLTCHWYNIHKTTQRLHSTTRNWWLWSKAQTAAPAVCDHHKCICTSV